MLQSVINESTKIYFYMNSKDPYMQFQSNRITNEQFIF